MANEDQDSNANAASNVLSIAIKDKAVLYATYMQFLKLGGIFIPTKKQYRLGERLSMMITLLSEKEQFQISGEVVWVTPPRAHGNRAAGIGVQFLGPEGQALNSKIQTLLATLLKSSRATHTM